MFSKLAKLRGKGTRQRREAEEVTSMNVKDDFMLVAAIDFGTTYSGYAYSTRHEFNTNPLNVNLMTWNAASGGLASQKAPTCVLFRPNESFHSFGHEAEDYYNELVIDDDHKGWFFFRRFKMDLYTNHISRTHMFKTADGKEMSAIKVISAVLSCLKGKLISKMNKCAIIGPESEIRWVVTVPAIWTPPAKQIMREAAELVKSSFPKGTLAYQNEAGIEKNQLILALEPEAASMLCRHLPVYLPRSGHRRDKIETFRTGFKYMIFDAGGGTIDITVHEVLKGELLKEIHASNGGDWGGTKVDEAMEEFFESIVGKDALHHFKSKEISSLIDLQRTFEVKKRSITGKDVTTKTTFTVPHSLVQSFEKYNPGKPIEDAVNVKHCSTDVEWKGDKIRLSHNKMLTLFEKSFKHITEHVSHILNKPEVKDCEAILMVGGYSECPLLQDAIRTVAGNIHLIVPSDASLTVLKGAVINGHRPDIVSERICQYTYGISTRLPFGEDGHDKYRFISKDDEVRCDKCFTIFVQKGLSVKIGSSITKPLAVGDSTSTSTRYQVYASTAENPKYVTDDSCQKIGEIILKMPDTSLGKDRGARVTMNFGGSEIEVAAVDKHSKRKISSCVDFLG